MGVGLSKIKTKILDLTFHNLRHEALPRKFEIEIEHS